MNWVDVGGGRIFLLLLRVLAKGRVTPEEKRRLPRLRFGGLVIGLGGGDGEEGDMLGAEGAVEEGPS